MLATSERAAAPALGGLAKPRVLLVDDDRASLFVLQSLVEGLGYDVATARNGAEAFALLRDDPAAASVLMTDRDMPVLDGLALTRRMKREAALKSIPIVLLTGADDTADVSAGIEAGAFYYLTKPPVEQLVETVLRSAMKEADRHSRAKAELKSHQSAFRNMQAVRFELRAPGEVDSTVSLLASMLAAPDRTIQGIYELVQNAVEHGVLRFGFEAKAQLLAAGRWEQALAERGADPQYADGVVEATAIRKENGVYIGVKDTGPGFDFRRWLGSDPSRSAALNGRGIARAANVAFDTLAFDGPGNRVVGFVASTPQVRW